MPLAMEKVNGIITIIIKAGRSSDLSDQFSLSIPLNINIATYIRAPEVACAGIMLAMAKRKEQLKIKNLQLQQLIPFYHQPQLQQSFQHSS